jgi:hypothetical protein
MPVLLLWLLCVLGRMAAPLCSGAGRVAFWVSVVDLPASDSFSMVSLLRPRQTVCEATARDR